MLLINLLPQETKKELKLLNIYGLIKKIIFLIILMTIFITAIIVFGKILLKTQINTSSLVVYNKNNTSDNISAIQKQVEMAKTIESSEPNWPKTIESVLASIDPSISVLSMKIDKDSSSIEITGVAKTREDLLNFKKSLESNTNYSNIDFPIRNLSEKQNINFSVKMNFKFL